ncbi:hypothetical protein BD779DRAFT_1457603, partial [Infundibulicybe gibba]
TYQIFQILSITCDNATSNNSMIDELAFTLPDFSAANRTQCFLHIVNLVRKSLTKQFDIPKKQADAAIDTAN